MDHLQTDAYRVEVFHDPSTSTLSYLLLDRTTAACAIVDAVLDYNPSSGATTPLSADRIIARVRALGAEVQWILETHPHADHLCAAHYLKQALGGRIAIGAAIGQVQARFSRWFVGLPQWGDAPYPFDQVFAEGDCFKLGNLPLRVMHTPGHTPACVSYLLDLPDAPLAFVGDTLFSPDYGTARCDFPGGDARALYRSIQRLLGLPGHTQLLLCHDYHPDGRERVWHTMVDEQRAHNRHIGGGISEAGFVQMREARDATLALPALMWPALQVNLNGGQLPAPESNGVRYLRIPLNPFQDTP